MPLSVLGSEGLAYMLGSLVVAAVGGFFVGRGIERRRSARGRTVRINMPGESPPMQQGGSGACAAASAVPAVSASKGPRQDERLPSSLSAAAPRRRAGAAAASASGPVRGSGNWEENSLSSSSESEQGDESFGAAGNKPSSAGGAAGSESNEPAASSEGAAAEGDSETGVEIPLLVKVDDRTSGNSGSQRHLHHKRSLIIVSHRLPVFCWREGNQWKVRWDDARSWLGNVKALQDSFHVKWVGCLQAHASPENTEERDQLEAVLAEHNCVPVFMPSDLQHNFLVVFCKQILWPLLHYQLPRAAGQWAVDWADAFQAYTRGNMMVAKVVAGLMESQSEYIWVHNHQLLLVPSFLRNKVERARVGLFVHTPFPTSDIWRTLPGRENLLRSILSCDLVGFHTYDYARHFLSACKRVLDCDFETMPGGMLGVKYSGRHVSIRISHVGIQSNEFARVAATPEVAERVRQLRSQFEGCHIIFGVEDLDVVKGSALKLQGYSQFLQNHPEWRDKVVFVQVIASSPFASGHPTNAEAVRAEFMAEVENIQRKYGENVIKVIERQNMAFEELVALYRASEAAVLSTFWDGLNLVPYEYTASQDINSPGALVLSEFSGCSRSLSGAIRVNPWNLQQVSEAIHAALSMSPQDRKGAHFRRHQYVMGHTLEKWALAFIGDLETTASLSRDLSYIRVGWGSNATLVGFRSDFQHLDDTILLPPYRRSTKRLLVFDYDGTLTEGDRHFWTPPPKVKQALRALSEDPCNRVFVLSGRERALLGEWFADIPNLGIAAEKGSFIKWPGHDIKEEGDKAWEHLCPESSFVWKPVALALIKEYTERTDGSYIEDKETAIVWHYENADPDYGRMQADELCKYLKSAIERPQEIEVTRYDYNHIVEIRPKNISKGLTLNLILGRVLKEGGEYALQAGPDLSSASASASGSSASYTSSSDSSSRSTPLPAAAAAAAPSTPPTGTSLLPATRHPYSHTHTHTHTQQSQQPLPFVLCIGDDRSDEEMFVALQESLFTDSPRVHSGLAYDGGIHGSALGRASDIRRRGVEGWKGHDTTQNIHGHKRTNTFTCCVGIKPSRAHYYLHNTDEVLQILQSLMMASLRNQAQLKRQLKKQQQRQQDEGVSAPAHTSNVRSVGPMSRPSRSTGTLSTAQRLPARGAGIVAD